MKWFKKLLKIVHDYDKDRLTDRSFLFQKIEDAEQFIRDRTTVDVDVGISPQNHSSQIIVVGRYRNNDYIQTYQMPDHDFTALVEHLRELSKYATIQRIDAPYGMKEMFPRDLKF
ncbi:hypothetical protein LCGC14_0470580 [marine sediment metagenome]|uniref:Uncharacterized protein n=1 Tax=marine sediment metagenome TaxID=412755 RepID=A0A0F9SHI0_9ZZZZ